MKGLVFVEEGLNGVCSGRYVIKTIHGIAQDAPIKRQFLPRLPVFSIDTENLLSLETDITNLKTRFVTIVLREE
jgi:hypothetical protein